MEERAVARREVEAVADQPVLGRVADPGEVLELVGREQAVRARQRAAAREQRDEQGQRHARERDQAAELDQVEPEPVGDAVHERRAARALRASGPRAWKLRLTTSKTA